MLAGLFAFGAQAQDEKKEKKTPEQKAELKVERMSKQLSLSPEQTAKLKEISLRQVEEHKVLQAEHKEIHAKLDKHRIKSIDEIKAELTPEQREKFEQKMAEREAKREEMKKRMKAFRKEMKKEMKEENSDK